MKTLNEVYITYSIINNQTGETVGSGFLTELDVLSYVLENVDYYLEYEIRKIIFLKPY